MRTSIDLPDSLFDAVKLRAQAQGRTFTSLVEEALRNALATHVEPSVAPPLPAYGDPKGRFLIDPTDREQLWAALDADRAR
jgi:hypothetical protein